MAGELSITLMDFPEIIQGIRTIGKTKVPTEVPPILQAAFGLTTAGIADGVPFYKIDIVSIFGKIGILAAIYPRLGQRRIDCVLAARRSIRISFGMMLRPKWT